MTPTAVSDAELLGQARDGDEAAFTELYVRHQAAAQRLANAYSRAGDPEDLVNESFERVLAALRRGAGPTEAFRAYLFVTLRRLAADRISRRHDEPVEEVPEPVRAEAQTPALDPADRQLVLAAYESLPDRWQAVLWQTAVEGRQPRDLAPALGMTANAAAALAYRAREKLRQAYLQAHLQAAPRPGCEPHRSRLGAYVRDGLSRRDRTATEGHLDDCGSCRGLVGELADVNRMLVRSIAPVFAVTATQIAAAVATGGSGTSGGSSLARRLTDKARANPAVVAGLVLVAALAFALISSQGGDDSALPNTDDPQGDKDRSEVSPEPPDPADSTDAESPDPSDPDAPDDPAEVIVPIRSTSPTTAPPGSPVTTAPPPGRPGDPAPTTPDPSPTPGDPDPTPPDTTPPPATSPPPPADDPYLVLVWLEDVAKLQLTVRNPTAQATAPLVLDLELGPGASVSSPPTGCGTGLLTVLLSGSRCGLGPVPAGGSRTVTVGVDVASGQPTAEVSVCAAQLLSLNCNGGLLGTVLTVLI